MAGRGGPKERGPKRRREKDDKGWQKRGKRKYCQFCKDKTRVDYNDVMTLRKYEMQPSSTVHRLMSRWVVHGLKPA